MEQKSSKEILQQYGVGPIQFTGTNDALYERHLNFGHVLDVKKADVREQFEAAAHSIRDIATSVSMNLASSNRRGQLALALHAADAVRPGLRMAARPDEHLEPLRRTSQSAGRRKSGGHIMTASPILSS